MKVILLQDIANVGHKNDVKELRDGYARNFLFPRKLVIPATGQTLENLARQQSAQAQAHEKEHQKYSALAERLKNTALTFTMKLGEKGQAFGSISEPKIIEELKKQGITIEKDWLLLEEHIKTAGEHIIPIKFPQELKGEVKIVVRAE